jgi:hypothetical protein
MELRLGRPPGADKITNVPARSAASAVSATVDWRILVGKELYQMLEGVNVELTHQLRRGFVLECWPDKDIPALSDEIFPLSADAWIPNRQPVSAAVRKRSIRYAAFERDRASFVESLRRYI